MSNAVLMFAVKAQEGVKARQIADSCSHKHRTRFHFTALRLPSNCRRLGVSGHDPNTQKCVFIQKFL